MLERTFLELYGPEPVDIGTILDYQEAKAHFTRGWNAADKDCICKGNLQLLDKETKHLIGKHFYNKGIKYHFFGLVLGEDDYYYGMWDNANKKLMLLSCVGDLETYGYNVDE